MGFGKHGHRNMEIISYVLSGELAHQDSMIPPGDVQRMSAGTGVTHSEFNHAKDQTTHFLQIWIEPNVLEIAPSYEQKTIPAANKIGKLCLVASPDGEANSVSISADAKMPTAALSNAPASRPIMTAKPYPLYPPIGSKDSFSGSFGVSNGLSLTVNHPIIWNLFAFLCGYNLRTNYRGFYQSSLGQLTPPTQYAPAHPASSAILF